MQLAARAQSVPDIIIMKNLDVGNEAQEQNLDCLQ